MENNASSHAVDIGEQSLEKRKTTPDPDNNEENGGKKSASLRLEQMKYELTDIPPWYVCVFLGLQHFLSWFFAQVAYATAVAVATCMESDLVSRSQILGSILFVGGIATILQTLLGVRLPIVQGSTIAFVVPILATMSLPQWKCADKNNSLQSNMPSFINSTTTIPDGINHMDFRETDNLTNNGHVTAFARMCEIQGAMMVAGLFEMVLATSGVITGFLMRVISPMVITAVISLLAITIIPTALTFSSLCWPVAAMIFVLVIIFSQVLSRFNVPLPGYSKEKKCHITRFPIFMVLPILTSVLLSWFICYILTEAGALGATKNSFGYSARTDLKSSVIAESAWVRVPYPLQWGLPTVSAPTAVGFIWGALAGVIESIGDYYMCARLAHGPPPPAHAINRGIFVEGVGIVLNGLIGTGQGFTSYSTNIVDITITKVASRRVVVYAGCWMIILGIFAKFGAVFTALPEPIIGGLYFIYTGFLLSAGLSNLQFVNVNSSRNMCVLGASLGLGIAIPRWIRAHPSAVSTGNVTVDQVVTLLMMSEMLVGGLLAMLLDNILPGNDIDRGMGHWGGEAQALDGTSEASSEIYNFPFQHKCKGRECSCLKYWPICPCYAGYRCFSRKKQAEKLECLQLVNLA